MSGTRPNILFITTDQQRWDMMGCTGNACIRTPHLDRLAREGILFERAYCENPICIPSRVTMITGKASRNHGATVHNCSMRHDERTLAHVLSQEGYRTRFIGKAHFKSQQHRGTEESIADWRDGMFEDWRGPYAGFEDVSLVLGHSNSLVGHYGKWLRDEHPGDYWRFMDRHLERIGPQGMPGAGAYRSSITEPLHSSTYVGDQTCGFLEDAASVREPFYCFASFPDPHWPIIPPTEYIDMYANVPVPQNTPYNEEAEKANYPRLFQLARNGKWPAAYNGGGRYFSDRETLEAITRAYWGAITLIDKNVGRILDTLDRTGLTGNTLIVFTADHGEYMGAHGLIAKGGFMYEEFIRVPFMARLPGVTPEGHRTQALLSFVDLVPTFLDVLGVESDTLTPDGVSQLAAMRGEAAVRERAAVIHTGLRGSAETPDIFSLLTPRWKLNYYTGDPNGELYDLEADPHELDNLYNRPQAKPVQDRLIRELLDEIIATNVKDSVQQWRGADDYGTHVMRYETWKAEFDALARETGRAGNSPR